ncbi:hypothetical protein GO495_07480 [Chitinophaga oryziterrae]|uniref:Uncharacterized protein n=1 Tax=Chitinophaga oryziterrae TaxID=1031224 RepID=A0A6N8J864_9BACT|nr:hypothetical protein [Chitinophaga oryziterrae]MVT40419.1 hypothetical protein [Chitinophaga oryziterrae]
MKCFFVPILLLLSLFSSAQLKTISQSPVFAEDESVGIQRVLLMKNGNTFYLSLTKKNLTVRVFSDKYKAKATKQLHPELGKGSSFKVKGLFDINGEVVVLVSAVENHQVVLQRLIIDGVTGALKSVDKIGELEKVSYFKLGGVAFANIPEPDFFSEALPEGNGYAVVAMNSFVSDRNKRIVVSIFDTDNKEISHAYYKSPEEKYKYMEYQGMMALDKNKLSVLAYGYNTKSSGGKECQLLLATLTKGDTLLETESLGTSKKPSEVAVARYNPVSKKMMLLELEDRTASVSIVDPFKKSVSGKIDIGSNGKSRSDMPQNLFTNEDGSFSIVYEKLSVSSNVPHIPGLSTDLGHTYGYYTSIEMEDYTVTVIAADGQEELQHYVIPRNHVRKNMMRSLAFNNAYTNFENAVDQPSPMESFNYLSAGGNNYLLLNDDADNIERIQAGKNPRKVKSLDDCDAFYYTLKGEKDTPPSDFLFGKPTEKRNYNKALFKACDYNADKKVYVVVKQQQNGNDGGWKLVWMKP